MVTGTLLPLAETSGSPLPSQSPRDREKGREKGQVKWEPLKLPTCKAMYEWLQLLSLPMQKLNAPLISLVLASYPNATDEFPISV